MTRHQVSPARGQARRALGAYGERLAARYLEEAGLEVLERNWRCDEGEIDILAVEQVDGREILAVVEVKTRSGDAFGSPAQAVTYRKLARLRRLGARWARESGVGADGIRIDIVEVMVPRGGGKPSVVHLEGVYL